MAWYEEEYFETEVSIAGAEVLVRTHNMPHMDEVLPMFMLQQEGTEAFIKKYCPDRLLNIGILRGDFDEHNAPGKGEKKGEECAATLIAKALGIEHKPEWRKMLRFTLNDDTGRAHNPRNIANILTNWHRQDPENQEKHVNWALLGLWVKYYDCDNGDYSLDRIRKVALKKNWMHEYINPEEWFASGQKVTEEHQRYFKEAIRELKHKRKTGKACLRVVSWGDVWLRTIALVSDNYRMTSALRAEKAGNSDAFVIKNSRGQAMLGINKKTKLDLAEVVKIITAEELRKSGQIITAKKAKQQAQALAGTGVWYYFKDMEAILNGGYTHPTVPATKISLCDLFGMLSIGLDRRVFHPKVIDDCLKGKCQGQKCSWYAYGLERCRNVRRIK